MKDPTVPAPLPFGDLPEDVQISVLSFLPASDIPSFACTSRRYASLCNQPRFWLAMCDRRWGSKTVVRRWVGTGKGSAFLHLYKTLNRWESLIGFWRQIGQRPPPVGSPLVFFEWGPCFITGSRISATEEPGSYGVSKVPFLWMGLSSRGEPLSVVANQGCLCGSTDDLSKLAASTDGICGSELVPVAVSFVGRNHFVLEDNRCSYFDKRSADESGALEDSLGLEGSSPPDRVMLEMYQYFANRTSPGADRASRRQRKKERSRFVKRSLESEHFVKICNWFPTQSRPLQGLWKGISGNMKLQFYLIAYDDIGGIACRRVGDGFGPSADYSPQFWTSEATFMEFPFPPEELEMYNSRMHMQPAVTISLDPEGEVLARILSVSSSYDLMIPNLSGPVTDNCNAEGRIWQYKNGNFGFGFLRDNFIINLKQVAPEGHLHDTIDHCNTACSSPSGHQ